MRQINRIKVFTTKVTRPVSFAVAPDLHNAPWDDVLPELLSTDAILVPGDLVDRHSRRFDLAIRFLQEMSSERPVFCSVGNHERLLPNLADFQKEADRTKAVLLHNRSVRFGEIVLGGLSSDETHRGNRAFLGEFENETGFRLLLCHHPEMYMRDVSGRNIDLTLCGHAHGGQIKLFGHGLYSPGQGVFPRLTDGFYDNGKMFLSRGMTNGAHFPRINVPTELVMLTILPEGDEKNDKGRIAAADGLV